MYYVYIGYMCVYIYTHTNFIIEAPAASLRSTEQAEAPWGVVRRNCAPKNAGRGVASRSLAVAM